MVAGRRAGWTWLRAVHSGTPGRRFLIFDTVWSFTSAAHGPSTVRRLLDAMALMSAERLVTSTSSPWKTRLFDQQTDGRAVLVDPAEVAELRDHPALLRLEHHHLVGLVARDPEAVSYTHLRAHETPEHL